jgi:cell division ATPase FtsA
MSSFESRSSTQYDSFIALDIGTYRIKAAVCSVENGNLKILGTAIHRQNRKDFSQGSIADLASVSGSIAKAIEKAALQAGHDPLHVIAGIPAHKQLFDSFSFQHVRRHPLVRIQMEELDSAIQKSERRSLERMATRIEQEVASLECEMKLVATTLTSISIDDRRVANPIGLTGRSLSVSVMNIFSPVSLYNTYRQIIEDSGRSVLSMIPHGIVLPKISDTTDFIFDDNMYVDIGYDHSTIALQHQGDLIGFCGIPFGTSMLEEALHRYAAQSYIEAEQTMMQFGGQSTSNSPLSARVVELCQSFCSVMAETILVSATDLRSPLYMRNIFLSGGGAYLTPLHHTLTQLCHDKLGIKVGVRNLMEIDASIEKKDPSLAMVHGIARTGLDFLTYQKDPLSQMLKFFVQMR